MDDYGDSCNDGGSATLAALALVGLVAALVVSGPVGITLAFLAATALFTALPEGSQCHRGEEYASPPEADSSEFTSAEITPDIALTRASESCWQDQVRINASRSLHHTR